MMYVIVLGDQILAFGMTPEQANADFVRRHMHFDVFDGPLPETYPCSPALYRQLEAEAGDGFIFIRCRINSDGVAVSLKGRPFSVIRRKG